MDWDRVREKLEMGSSASWSLELWLTSKLLNAVFFYPI